MEGKKEKPKPKKRGRKPKNITQVKKGGKNVNIEENLIIKLKNTNKEQSNIVAYESNNIFHDQLDGSFNIGEICWNCCHPFHGIVHGLPLKYINEVFYVYGDFCSLECAARYSSEYFKDTNFENMALINLYNNIINKTEDSVRPAPNKLVLKIFGGNLKIDEYRDDFNKPNIHDIKLPPILPIKHTIDMYETNNGNTKNNLKLFRKKPLPSENKSISTSMKLN